MTKIAFDIETPSAAGTAEIAGPSAKGEPRFISKVAHKIIAAADHVGALVYRIRVSSHSLLGTRDNAVGFFARVYGPVDLAAAQMGQPTDISERRRIPLLRAKREKSRDPIAGAAKKSSAMSLKKQILSSRPGRAAHARAPPSMGRAFDRLLWDNGEFTCKSDQ